MIKNTVRISLLAIVCTLSSCEVAKTLINPSLTEAEMQEGLKEALRVGSDTTAKLLSKQGAYLTNEALKISLPKEASDNLTAATNALSKLKSDYPLAYNTVAAIVFDPQKIQTDLIKSMNTAAEGAAIVSAPIFKKAVNDMSILDAANILYGTDSSATTYLKDKTFTNLTGAYSPKIDSVLNKPLVLGKSTNDLWNSYNTTYGTFATSVNALSALTGITVPGANTGSLGTYVTQKALTGLFYSVKNEEKSIRKDPLKRVTDILKKVFGTVK